MHHEADQNLEPMSSKDDRDEIVICMYIVLFYILMYFLLLFSNTTTMSCKNYIF